MTPRFSRSLVIAFLALVLSARKLVAAPVEPVLELPPLLVEESKGKSDWRYVRVNNFEFLSLCSDSESGDFINGVYRAHQVLRFLIPNELQVQLSVPTGFILYPRSKEQSLSSSLLAKMKEVAQVNSDYSPRMKMLPGLRLDDSDSTLVFALLGGDFPDDPSGMAIEPGYAAYLLANRTPIPPPWLVAGLVGLFQSCAVGYDSISVEPLTWISKAKSDELHDNPDGPRALLPLSEIFQLVGPPRGTDEISIERAKVWTSEAALFVRWAHDEGNDERIAAFRKFAIAACERPITELFFKECFGLGYAQMRDELSDYLSTAVSSHYVIHGNVEATPRIEMEDATKEQIARIRGEWERRASKYMGTSSATLGRTYLEQSQNSFDRGIAAGIQDPQLFAAAGILSFEKHDEARARSLLEAAVRASVVRPEAYLDLALVLYHDALRHPGGKQPGDISVEQKTPVADIVLRGLKQEPQIPGLFILLSDLEIHSEDSADGTYLALLDKGARLYPDFPILVYRVAVLEAIHGNKSEVDWLISQSLRRGLDKDERDRLLRLRAKILEERAGG